MRIKPSIAIRVTLIISLMMSATVLSARLQADNCAGVPVTLPFTDLTPGSVFFCSIAEAYFSGLTNGTTPTTYGPASNVPREQMAAFVSRTLDQSLKRGSRRAALDQFSTPTAGNIALTTVGTNPALLKSDGADLWVANNLSNTVSRVRASDGALLQTWTGATGAYGVVLAKGLIFVLGQTIPTGKLYQIDPSLPGGGGAVTPLASVVLGNAPYGIAFDGARIWTANISGSVNIVTLNPLSVNTVTMGFISPTGILYDGSNIWITDTGGAGNLHKLSPTGGIIQTVSTQANPINPVFDGTNIWVPNDTASSVTVVRASTGAILATLTGNGLNRPLTAAFDGERILVTNSSGNSVSFWKAADLSPLGSVATGAGTTPWGACSDGLNFWVTLRDTGKLARF